jgi:phenylpropionate dioxygenase-like ring-hydroxylating dioxygenase large terminal subunit
MQDTPPLRDVWYYALPSAALKTGKTIAKLMLGEPILIGRDAGGQVFAMADLCPHRGIPLRFGRFDGREVECCYHGWRFGTDGACTAIPPLVDAEAVEIGRIRVKSYPAREVQGGIWLFFGEDESRAPPIPVLPEFGDARPGLVETMRFAASIDHAVLGLMDPGHGPYVHRSWYWRSKASVRSKSKAFEASPWGFTMSRHAPSANSRAYKILGGNPETEIVFRLPSVRWDLTRAGRHVVANLTMLTPITATETEINHAVYWTLPWAGLFKPVIRHFVRAFLGQDGAVIEKQQQGLAHAPSLLLLGDPDAQARWYYRLKAEFRRAREEGRDFVNPVRDRVLKWRS